MRVNEYRVERNQALVTLDLEWARRYAPRPASDDVLMIALHKARYECRDVADDLRLESARWLMQRGYRRSGGLPFPADGTLPK